MQLDVEAKHIITRADTNQLRFFLNVFFCSQIPRGSRAATGAGPFFLRTAGARPPAARASLIKALRINIDRHAQLAAQFELPRPRRQRLL